MIRERKREREIIKFIDDKGGLDACSQILIKFSSTLVFKILLYSTLLRRERGEGSGEREL